VARLVVLASRELADGFRLAGAPTFAAGADDAAAGLWGIVAEPDVGIVFVTADLWAALDERSRDAVERLNRPLVLQVPVGVVAEAVGRRAVIEEMLQRAIGYRTEIAGAAERGGRP
jgi:vacuolar-type H+-ATPase subunit F/Vma7